MLPILRIPKTICKFVDISISMSMSMSMSMSIPVSTYISVIYIYITYYILCRYNTDIFNNTYIIYIILYIYIFCLFVCLWRGFPQTLNRVHDAKEVKRQTGD